MKSIEATIDERKEDSDWVFTQELDVQRFTNNIAYEMLELFVEQAAAYGYGYSGGLEVTVRPYENCDVFASFDLLGLLKQALINARDDCSKDMTPIKKQITELLDSI